MRRWCSTQAAVVGSEEAVLVKPAPLPLPPLPAFVGISMNNIVQIKDLSQLIAAEKTLLAQEIIGFDSETKASFGPSHHPPEQGPHLVQFSTLTKAYLFTSRPNQPHSSFQRLVHAAIGRILESNVQKVGFGLSSDHSMLAKNLNISAKNIIDLALELRTLSSRNSMGTVNAVRTVLQQEFKKPKRITVSNWCLPLDRLQPNQITYAANDAYVALRVYHEWQRRMACGEMPRVDPKHREKAYKLLDLQIEENREKRKEAAKTLAAGMQPDDLLSGKDGKPDEDDVEDEGEEEEGEDVEKSNEDEEEDEEEGGEGVEEEQEGISTMQ